MADWNGFKKNGTTYIPNDATARGRISTIEGKVAGAVQWADAKGYVGKNLLNNILTSNTVNGITYIVNKDKSVTVYGTATGALDLHLHQYTKAEFQKAMGGIGASCKLSGCPVGGSTLTYFIRINGSPWLAVADDTGSGASFTVPEAASQTGFDVNLSIKSGVNMGTAQSPKVFYPMISPANTPSDYEPYIPDNTELFPRSEQEVLGAVNVFKPITQTVSNASQFIVDSDEYISHPANDYTDTRQWAYANSNIYMTLPKGTWKVSAYQKTAYTTGGQGFAIMKSDNTKLVDLASSSTGFISLVQTPVEITLSEDTNVGIEYKLGDGAYAIMITPSTTPTDKHIPYAMTNRELTDRVQGITVKSFTTEQFTINAGQYSPQEISIANGDLIPLGIVGYRIDGNGNTECGMWKNWMDIPTKKALFGVKNFSANATATVTVTIFVLYKG